MRGIALIRPVKNIVIIRDLGVEVSRRVKSLK
jgi:hypothetical protein